MSKSAKSSLPVPPDFTLKDTESEKSLLLVLYNRNLRNELLRFRNKWSAVIKSEENSFYQKKQSPDTMKEIEKDIDKMMELFNPPLTKNWHNVLLRYAVTNKVGEQKKIPKSEIQAVTGLSEVQASEAVKEQNLAIALTNHTSPFEVRLDSTESPKVVVSIYGQMDDKDWSNLKQASRSLLRYIKSPPPITITSSQIKLMSLIADKRNQSPKISYKNIYTELLANTENKDEVPSVENLRTLYKHSKSLGL